MLTARRDRGRFSVIWQVLTVLSGVALLASSSAMAVHSHLALCEESTPNVSGAHADSHSGEGEADDHAVAPCALCGASARDAVADAVGPAVVLPHPATVALPMERSAHWVRGFDTVAPARGPPSV